MPSPSFYGLSRFGYDLFLDRYALKHTDPIPNLYIGATVVVNNDTAKKTQRNVGTIKTLDTEAELADVFLSDNTMQENVPLRRLILPIETDPADLLRRVAEGIASVEPSLVLQQYWTHEFKELLTDWKFVPGGRILTVAGTKQRLTAYNCYVLPSPKDSRGAIYDTAKDMVEIMARGGGVGINVSSLRPRLAPVRGVNGHSNGAVSWAGLYSFSTGQIMQAGSRRGALMVMLNDWHPDLKEFINAKRERGDKRLENCNISVALSDKFMEAVKADGNWILKFPETNHPAYDEEWQGDIAAWEAKGYPVQVYETIKARELWDMIIDSAWSCAEPGIFFLERYNKFSNSSYYPEGRIVCCNPCAEQGLPNWGVCNLGALNLGKFFDSASGDVNYELLAKSINSAVRFLDNVIDWTPYFFSQNEEQQKAERRVGLGVMGLAELMIRCKVRYGSTAGIEWTKKLFEFISYHAYLASARIAREKGSFPKFEVEGFLSSEFMKRMNPYVVNEIRRSGMRNVTLLTIAPTGTTSTMLETSGGVEPYYAWTYFRQSRLGLVEQTVPLVQEYFEAHPEETELPDYFVTAMQLSPEEHVGEQAGAQYNIDTSISKTVNTPQHSTKADTAKLYMLMYDLGCKGGTIYRDNSRSEQVLSLKVDEVSIEGVDQKALEAAGVDMVALQAAMTEGLQESIIDHADEISEILMGGNYTAPLCPDCSTPMENKSGCWECTCGASLCTT